MLIQGFWVFAVLTHGGCIFLTCDIWPFHLWFKVLLLKINSA
jgi:hypothetical protein